MCSACLGSHIHRVLARKKKKWGGGGGGGVEIIMTTSKSFCLRKGGSPLWLIQDVHNHVIIVLSGHQQAQVLSCGQDQVWLRERRWHDVSVECGVSAQAQQVLSPRW